MYDGFQNCSATLRIFEYLYASTTFRKQNLYIFNYCKDNYSFPGKKKETAATAQKWFTFEVWMRDNNILWKKCTYHVLPNCWLKLFLSPWLRFILFPIFPNQCRYYLNILNLLHTLTFPWCMLWGRAFCRGILQSGAYWALAEYPSARFSAGSGLPGSEKAGISSRRATPMSETKITKYC